MLNALWVSERMYWVKKVKSFYLREILSPFLTYYIDAFSKNTFW